MADELIETAPGLFFRDPTTNKLAVGNAREYEHVLEKVRVQGVRRGAEGLQAEVCVPVVPQGRGPGNRGLCASGRQHQGRGLKAGDRVL